MLSTISVSKNFLNCTFSVQIGIGEEQTQKWLDTDIVACLENFFIKCQTGNFLDDPEVLLFENTIDVINVRGLLMSFCFCSD